jgi:hypothetical protein
MNTEIIKFLIFLSTLGLSDSPTPEEFRDKLDENRVKNTITYKYLSAFNSNVRFEHVNQMDKVVSFYKFNSTDYKLQMLLGQVVSESGARHYRSNVVIKSNTGAIGICQILGSTAYDSMTRLMDSTSISDFKVLGATNFDFAYDKSITKYHKIRLAKEWLLNSDNNIIMWGYLMNEKLGNKNIDEALIAYNIGDGGFRKYIRNGGSRKHHHYIKAINRNVRIIKKRLSF